MNRLQTIFLLFSVAFLPVKAQQYSRIFEDLQKESTSTGKVEIYQDEDLKLRFYKHVHEQAKEKGIAGYSILIFFETGPESRKNAEKVRSRFLSKYENVSCTKLYQPPYWRVYVGEFRTKSEAYKFLHTVRKDFPYAYVRPSVISYPKITFKASNNDR